MKLSKHVIIVIVIVAVPVNHEMFFIKGNAKATGGALTWNEQVIPEVCRGNNEVK